MIEVTGLTRKYGNRLALDHLSFSLEKGRVCGFLGPNGAGKSTAMNMIAGYLGIEEGEVLIHGVSMRQKPEEAKRSIGYLPEIPPLYPDMTVEEYLRFIAELKKIPKDQRAAQVEEVIGLAGLGALRGRLIRNLSKGYRQRVGLAYAIIGSPELIILDEPTVGLDPRQVAEVRAFIAGLAGEHTVLFSSHILSEVQQLCDTVIILDRGRAVASGSLDELERQLCPPGELILELRAPADRCAALCAGVPGVEAVAAEERDGLCVLRVRPVPGADPREALFFAFARAETAILSMKYDGATLEDLFLRLTMASDGGEEGGET